MNGESSNMELLALDEKELDTHFFVGKDFQTVILGSCKLAKCRRSSDSCGSCWIQHLGDVLDHQNEELLERWHH